MWWLKTTQINFLIILKARSPKWILLSHNQGVGRAASLPGSLREKLISFPFPASSACLHSLAWDPSSILNAGVGHLLPDSASFSLNDLRKRRNLPEPRLLLHKRGIILTPLRCEDCMS